jgi:hypothetical protein
MLKKSFLFILISTILSCKSTFDKNAFKSTLAGEWNIIGLHKDNHLAVDTIHIRIFEDIDKETVENEYVITSSKGTFRHTYLNDSLIDISKINHHRKTSFEFMSENSGIVTEKRLENGKIIEESKAGFEIVFKQQKNQLKITNAKNESRNILIDSLSDNTLILRLNDSETNVFEKGNSSKVDVKKNIEIAFESIEKNTQDIIIATFIEISTNGKRIAIIKTDYDGKAVVKICSDKIVDDKIVVRAFGLKCAPFAQKILVTQNSVFTLPLSYGETQYQRIDDYKIILVKELKVYKNDIEDFDDVEELSIECAMLPKI